MQATNLTLQVSTRSFCLDYFSSLQIHKQAPINQQLRSAYIRTQLTRQKHRRARQILRLPQPAQRNSAFHVLPLALVRHVLVIQLRPDRAWEESVAADVVLAQRAGCALHEGQDARFRGRVVGLSCAAYERGDGRDADDAPAWRGLGGHLLRGGLHGEEGSVEVGVDGEVHEVRGHAVERSAIAAARRPLASAMAGV